MVNGTLDRIVAAVSDGEPIDWSSARRNLTDPDSQRACAHLETLSKIGHLAGARHGTPNYLGRQGWATVLLTVALLHIALGLIGFIAYRPYSLINTLRILTLISFTGIGVLLRWTRDNARARDLGAVFILIALGFSRLPYTVVFDAWFSGVPQLFVLRTGLAVDAWAPFFIWQFVRRFPTTRRFTQIDRTAIACARVAALVGTALFAVNLWASLTQPSDGLLRTFAYTYEENQRFSAVIFLLTLPALAILFLRARLAPADERARVRLFSFAMIAGIAPTYVEVLLEALIPSYTAFLRGSATALKVMVTAVLLPLLAVPFLTAYSVVIHRLLDVRLVIRQGLRYLLAKWTLVALTLTPFVLLGTHVYTRRYDSVVVVVSDPRGLLLLALVGLGGTLLLGKAYLLRTLDRWFDRRTSDRTAVLAQSGNAMRLVRGRSELVACVREATVNAMNAPATVCFFDGRRNAYVPFERGGLSLAGDSALATILTREASVAVLAMDGEQSLSRFLPHGEQLWLAEHSACAVAPIRSSGVGRPAGLIVCGPRSDALGHSRDDERFLTALASAAGIAYDNLQLKSDAVGDEIDDFGMLCVRCHRVVDAVEKPQLCPCGGDLEAAAVPRRINGKFLVEGLLGTGGMGVAYLARDIALDRYVAIKTLPAVSPEAMERLAREARTMAGLSHANLATILGQESWRGTPILVCEYLSGGTLQQRLARGPIAAADAVGIAARLLEALEYMHGEGVLHRDIKPSNIAFTRDKTPKLLDFGLAGLLEHAQLSSPGARSVQATAPAGTLAYLPPDAFAGSAPTAQFDLWALAVVLFEAIAGRHPFAAGMDTPHNICRGRIIATLNTHPAVAAFLDRALRPGFPSFASATAMREALLDTRIALLSEKPEHA